MPNLLVELVELINGQVTLTVTLVVMTLMDVHKSLIIIIAVTHANHLMCSHQLLAIMVHAQVSVYQANLVIAEYALIVMIGVHNVLMGINTLIVRHAQQIHINSI